MTTPTNATDRQVKPSASKQEKLLESDVSLMILAILVIVPKEREFKWLEPKLSIDSIKTFFNPFYEKNMEAFEVDKRIIA